MTEHPEPPSETPKSDQPKPAAATPVDPRFNNPGAAETLAEVFHQIITNLHDLRESTERTHTSLIAYMDRVILLAGGTLTLTFTAVTTLGAHLKESHGHAEHVHFVSAACWLLVATIILGLIYNGNAIKLREREDIQNGLAIMHTQTKLKLLSIPGVTDVKSIDAIPPLVDPKQLNKHIAGRRGAARLLSFFAQLSLVAAFVFLTLFIQSNIGEMLSSNPTDQPQSATPRAK